MQKYISPIAIDLGAKASGIFMTHYESGANIASGIHRSLVVTTPEKDLTINLTNRRSARHTRRNYKRAKLAKRLMALIGEKALGIKDFNSKPIQTLWANLMNRRGYTYLGVDQEFDQNELAFLVNNEFSLFEDDFDLEDKILELLKKIQPDEAKEINEKIASILEQIATDTHPSTSNVNITVPILKEYRKALEVLKKQLEPTIKASETGHFKRDETFKNLEADFKTLTEFEPLKAIIAKKLTEKEFLNIICHINNLQLRVLRKFFNSKDFRNGDIWQEERFKKVFLRYIDAWHSKENKEKENRKYILNTLKNGAIIDWFKKTDPIKTIPPFEDQNNRSLPHPQTLILDINYLNQELENWREITLEFIKKESIYFSNYEKALKEECGRLQKNYSQFNASLNKKAKELKTEDDWYLARALQFILDRNSSHDLYNLRKVSQEKDYKRKAEDKKIISNLLGQNNTDKFLDFLSLYYKETFSAKNGEWFEEIADVLKVDKTNPPRKQKLLHYHVAAILGIDSQIIKGLNLHKEGLKALNITKSHASAAAKAIKDNGNELKVLLNDLDNIEKPNKTEKELKTLRDNAEKNAEQIKARLEELEPNLESKYNLSKDWHKKFSSIFSLAQLYNILEEDRSGFSKTSYLSTIDNSIRSSTFFNGKAFASRLTSNIVRPFDGVMKKVLDAQALKIAKVKLEQIESIESGKITIPVIVEQNRFTFTEGLFELKKKRKNAKNIKERGIQVEEKILNQFKDKKARIAEDGFGLCPYTGQSVSLNSGEIDHIIPRSETLKEFGFVLNGEANLILCSSEANQKYSNKRKSFNDLNTRYLSELFGNADKDGIKEEIKEQLEKIQKTGLNNYYLLPQKERNLIRHALFDDELKYSVIKLLKSQFKTRVNGTQNYLAQKIIKFILNSHLISRSIEIDFSYHEIPANEISILRNELALLNEDLAKPEIQPIYSHIIDAQLALIKALERTNTLEQDNVPFFKEEQSRLLEQFKQNDVFIEKTSAKAKLLRKRPESAPLFKAGMYAERYIPLIALKNGNFGIGFSPKNYLPFSIDKEIAQKVFEKLILLLNGFAYYKDQSIGNLDMVKELLNNNSFICLNLKAKEINDYLLNNQNKELELLYEGLRYNLQKTSVSSLVATINKNKKNWREKIKKGCEQKFSIKLKEIIDIKVANIEKEISLPILDEWQFILNDPNIDPELEDLDDYLNKLFENRFYKTQPERKHQLKRKVFSLPLISSPSGGFRIKRIGWNQNITHQVMAVEGSYKAGNINYKQEVCHKVYLSKNIKPLDMHITNSKNFIQSGVPYKCNVPYELKNIIKELYLTKAGDRFWVEIEVPQDLLLEEINKELDKPIKSIFDLDSEITITSWEDKKYCVFEKQILGKVRAKSKITIKKMGEFVRIYYCGESGDLKKIYFNNAKATNI